MMARVTRVLADFDMPAVPLGDGAAADPFLIECGDGAVRGAGRWTDPQHWTYVFDRPLAGAVSCQARPNPAFRDLQDRKSTRLNSSHVKISYAVFCLKKKK